MTIFHDTFSEEVWASTYKDYNDKTVDDTLRRVAKFVASAETKEKQKEWEEKFYDMLSDFKCTAGGRIYANAGTEFKGTTMMNCFTPDAKVLTSEGYKEIQSVEIGDYVLTHKGRWRRVDNVLIRPYEGDVINVFSNYFTNSITATPNHKFYQGNGNWEEIQSCDSLLLLSQRENVHVNPVVIDLVDFFQQEILAGVVRYDETKIWTETKYSFGKNHCSTKTLLKGHTNRFVPVNDEFAYFIGRFIGDGCSYKHIQTKTNPLFEKNAFNIVFNNKEIDSLHHIKQLIHTLFGPETGISDKGQYTYIVKFNSLVATFLHRFVGDKGNTKRISSLFFTESKDVQRAMLRGIFDSDGFVNTRGEIKIVLANEDLVNDIQMLLLSVGIPSTKTTFVQSTSNSFNASSSFALFIGRTYGEQFKVTLSKVYDDQRLTTTHPIKKPTTGPVQTEEGMFRINVTKSIEYYNGYVYNLSVNEDNSYVVNNVVVKNCYVSPRDTYDIDSIPGIIKDVLNQCQTLKSEGGWGQNFSWIRPRGAFIHGIGVETPGAVKYMEIYDKTSDVITSGSGRKTANKKAKGKIRKGAMMGVIDCIAGNTPINTIEGKIPVKDLVDQNPYLYCTDGKGNVHVRQALKVWSKGIRKTIKVVFDNDDCIECTPEHEFMLSDGSFKKAKDLLYGESLAALNKRLLNGYLNLSITGSRRVIAEHNAVYEMKYGEYPTILTERRHKNCTIAHHIDHNKWNNIPGNIQQMTFEDHSRHHSEHIQECQRQRAARQRGTTWEEFYGEDRAHEIKKKYVAKRKGQKPWNYQLKGEEYKSHYLNGFGGWAGSDNHKVVRVEESIEQEVFDIAMPDYHNFVANGVFIHNCWHPDVEEFIRAKQQPGRLTKFNISVNCTDEFMNKVLRVQELKATECSEQQIEQEDRWNLRFPDTTFEKYKQEWDGDLRKWESKQYPVVVYRTISATKLWETIMESTYNRAEPGVLFLDRANYFGPLSYLETIFATNPSMPAGTLVHTDGGIVPIEFLENKNFKVKSLDSVWADARCRLSGENEELIEISFGENRSIRSTKEHRWPVYDTRMKRIYKTYAHELKPGDLIPLNRNEAFGVASSDLLFDEGFLVGYIVGDGWFSNKGDGTYNVGITFGNTERVMAERILKIVNNLKSTPSTIIEKETGELCIQFSTNQLTNKMIERYGMVPGSKEIPSSVWTGSEQYIKGFVDGLLSSDGHVFLDKSNQRIVLTTSREILAQQFGKLLGFAGIPVSIWHRSTTSTFPNGKDYEKTYERWDVAVHGKALINFFNVFSISHPDKFQALERAVSYVMENKRDSLQQQFAKVVSVKPVGSAKVWDISVAHNQHVFPTEWCYTGNCGEQTLAPGGVCNLGSINLAMFINETRTGFNLDAIKKYTRYLNRFLDNINTLSNAPLPEYIDSMRKKRRVGIGILGWGSALFMLKIRFGSERAAELRDQVMGTIAREAYMSSIDLAEEKQMFEYCIPEKHAEGVFVNSLGLPSEYMEKLKKIGIRNSSLLSIQPTGNTSIFANIVSGGLEPIFMPEYIRTVIVNTMPDEIADVCPKWFEGEWKETEMFKFAKEGDEEILRGEHNGIVYKIDMNRGLTKEVLCQDYGVRWLAQRGEWDPKAEWAVTTLNLSVQDHVEDLKGFAKWVDSAMSKCVAKGTLISTSRGIKPIEALGVHHTTQEGFVVPIDEYTVLDENGNEKRILSHYYGGNKPCATVRFSNGFELTAAYTHMLKTSEGWKRVSEIEPGDKVFYRTNSFNATRSYVKVPKIQFAVNAKHKTFPDVVDEDFAMFIGMWIADGSLTDHSISICEKNSEVEDLCTTLMNRLFGTHKVALDDRWGVRTHYVHSSSVARWFKQHFGHGAEHKRIPQWLLDSPPSVWKAFIEGVTLDGYVKKNEYSSSLVVFDGYAKDVAEKLTYMLSTMGIQYSLVTRSVGEGKVTYGVNAWLEDQDSIVPIESHKNEYIPLGKRQKQTHVSDQMFEEMIERQPRNTYGSIMRARLRKCQLRGNFVRMSFLENLGINYDENLTCVSVTDVCDVGNKEVYDIEVEDTHSYLINGIVSHNTVNVPHDYPFEDFKNIYLDSYKSGYVKGVTTYRAGTMTTVLSAKEEKEGYEEEVILEEVKLPAQAPAMMNVIRAEGRKWYLTVVMDEQQKRPVAFFVQTNHHEKTSITDRAVELLIELARSKKVPEKWIQDTLNKIEKDNNHTKIARCISLNLRHGVLIKNVVAVLDNVDDAFVGSFVFLIKRFLMSYIKDGEKAPNGECPECGAHDSFVYSEGCLKCSQCSYSRCG